MKIIFFLVIACVVTVELYAQEGNKKITSFIQTAEQSRDVWQLIQARGPLREKVTDFDSKIENGLVRVNTFQSENSLCDDGVIVYLKARANNGIAYITVQSTELLLRELKSPMEEESLMLADSWINHLPSHQSRAIFQIIPSRNDYSVTR